LDFKDLIKLGSMPLCSTCKNTIFSEDDAGFLICTICGTQSQEYFSESFILEDMGSSIGRNTIKEIRLKVYKLLALN
jgi:uncharacterized Zn finger protein (UPF0148 family)